MSSTESSARAAVHEQTIDGYGAFRVRPVDPARDATVLHRWVTHERARFWGMTEHSLERILEIYLYLDTLTTHHAYLVELDGSPVALFQTYQPEADEISEYYTVQAGDLGMHLLIGPAVGETRPGFTGSVVTVFVGFMLADETIIRILAEPDARNDKAIARFIRTGFVLGPEVELPLKRARLVFLHRDDAPILR
jgi:penicillin amidase